MRARRPCKATRLGKMCVVPARTRRGRNLWLGLARLTPNPPFVTRAGTTHIYSDRNGLGVSLAGSQRKRRATRLCEGAEWLGVFNVAAQRGARVTKKGLVLQKKI